MVKQFIRNIKYLFLRTEHIRLLDEENISLQRALVEAIDLVSDYKRAIQEMQRMIAMIHRDTVGQMESDFTDYENNEEDEVEKEYYKALMKKTTIH
jgi:hypothetical protein|tara:strand:- start:253 stop:540 length:288 start_codon:yes stop_codon:yes gene_type:complete